MVKYRASEESNEDSSALVRKRHSKDCSVRTSEIVERAQALISENSNQSLRTLAKIIGVSEPTMYKIAEEDL